jgi:hypothetical protein
MKSLKSIALSAGESLGERQGLVHVLVDLKTRTAEPDCLERLEAHGLTIDRVVGNKVLGTIKGESLESLRLDPAVAEVEISSRLRPHAIRSSAHI